MFRSDARRLLAGTLVLTLLCAAWLAPVARAQDEKALQEEVSQAVQSAQKSLAEKIVKIVSQRLGKRLADVEKALAQKERQIAELRQQVEKLLAQKQKPKQPLKPTNAFLGVSHTDNAAGAQVTTVLEGSPAAAAGLKQGDIIKAVNGKAVSSESLTGALTRLAPGIEVKLSVARGGKDVEVVAKLTDREKFHAAQAARARKPAQPQPVVLGIEVVLEGDVLVIDVVDEGFTGHVIGLAKGDRILQVNGQGVSSIEQIGAAVRKIKSGEKFTLRTQRGSEVIDVEGVGSYEKGGAKLVQRKPVAPKEPAKPPKPAPARKPAYLGVQVADVDKGILIEEVSAGTSAAAYGLARNDVITKCNGKDVRTIAQLEEVLTRLSAGDKISVVVLRGSDTKEFKDIVLGARGEKVAAPVKPAPAAKPGKKGYLGVSAQEFSVEKLLVVKDVISGGAGEKAGLKAGDVIVKVGDKAISGFEDLEAALKDLKVGETVTLVVKRNDKEMEVQVTLGDKLAEGLEG